MAADGVREFVQGASEDPQPEWWKAFRQLEEKMQDDMRMQKEDMQAALDQKVQEAEKRMEKKLKDLEERVVDLEGRRLEAQGDAGGSGGEGTARLVMNVTPTEATVQRMPESVGHGGGILEALLVSSLGTGEQMETEVEQEILIQQESVYTELQPVYPSVLSMEDQLNRDHVAVGRTEVEHMEIRMTEDPLQPAPEYTSHRGSVSRSTAQLPLSSEGQVESGIAQAIIAQPESSVQGVLEAVGSSGSALESSLEGVPVAGVEREADQMSRQEQLMQQAPETKSQHRTVSVSPLQLPVFAEGQVEAGIAKAFSARAEGSVQGGFETSSSERSALESPLGSSSVAQGQGEVQHLEEPMIQEEELISQVLGMLSHRSVLLSKLQAPAQNPKSAEAALAEALLAQAVPESAGPSGGPSELHQDTWRPEAPPARRTSRASSGLSVVSYHSTISERTSVSLSPILSEDEEEEEDLSLGASTSHARTELGSPEEALAQAAASGLEDEVRRLLLAGAEVNYADAEKMTPLMLAAKHGKVDTVVQLLKEGADVNFVTVTGSTALHFAGSSDTTGQCVSTLLAAGANRESRDVDGRTPLHLAALSDNETAAFELAESGASKSSKDKDGNTPYECATSERLRHILRLYK